MDPGRSGSIPSSQDMRTLMVPGDENRPTTRQMDPGWSGSIPGPQDMRTLKVRVVARQLLVAPFPYLWIVARVAAFLALKT